MVGYVLGNQCWCYKFLCMFIWNLEINIEIFEIISLGDSNHLKTKLILYSHDNLHVIKGVQPKVIDEVTVQSQLVSCNLKWTELSLTVFLCWV